MPARFLGLYFKPLPPRSLPRIPHPQYTHYDRHSLSWVTFAVSSGQRRQYKEKTGLILAESVRPLAELVVAGLSAFFEQYMLLKHMEHSLLIHFLLLTYRSLLQCCH